MSDGIGAADGSVGNSVSGSNRAQVPAWSSLDMFRAPFLSLKCLNVKKSADNRAGIFRVIVLLVMVFAVSAVVAVRSGEKSVKATDEAVTALADCLSSKGVKMYGTYWCSHCAKQKKDFGESFSKIGYVECSVEGNPRELAKECADAGIDSFPTWTFPDGSRQSGEMSFGDLADKAGCSWTEPAND